MSKSLKEMRELAMQTLGSFQTKELGGGLWGWSEYVREELELKQGPLEGIKCKNYMTEFIRNPPAAVPRIDILGQQASQEALR